MPDRLRIDYDLLHQAQKDLEALAEEIGPLLTTGIFSELSDNNFYYTLGDHSLEGAMRVFHSNAFQTLHAAEKGLKELAVAFGQVGAAALSFDADLAQNMGVMGSTLGLQNWRRDKAVWDYKQAHLDQCTPGEGGEVPGFCSATDPGPPPLEQTFPTEHGNIHTKLTLDADGNVIREETTVTYDGKEHKTVTNYTDKNGSGTTETTYPDNTTMRSESHINDDGSGTMVVTDTDGKRTEYTRGPRDGAGELPEWQEVETNDPSGNQGGNTPGDDPKDDPYFLDPF
ncbi:hypothetical protein ACWCPF_10485 [Streptomyces sp. NPDC001858]